MLSNEAFQRNTGFSRDETIGNNESHLQLYADPEDQMRLRKALRAKGRIDNFELHLRDKGQRSYTSEISASIIHYQGIECVLSVTTAMIAVKQAEEAVRESETRFFDILERIDEGYFEVDLSGRFTFFNQALSRISGYTPDELSAMSYRDYLPPEAPESIYEIYNRIFQARRKEVLNYEIVHKDGRRIHVETSAGLLYDKSNHPTGFFGVMRDRTQQHHIAEALRKSEETYRSFLDLAPDVVTIGRIEDGRYLYVNDTFYQKTGYTVKETIGRTPLELRIYLNPEDREHFITKLWEDKIVRDLEIPFRSKDGTIRIYLVSARLVRYQDRDCLLTIAKEITAIKEVEQALRGSEESLRITLNSIGEAVIATDTRGCITRMNPVAEGLTGWPFREAAGRDLSEIFRIVNERSRRAVESPVEKVLTKGRIVGLGNSTLLISRDDKEHPISDSAAPIRDADGEIVGVVLVFRDVTAKREAERKLRESELKHRTVLENMEEGYFEIGLDGQLIFFNDSVLRLHGYPAEELRGMHYSEFLHAESAEKLFQVFKQMYETGQPTPILEYEVIRKDGAIRLCEMTSYPQRSASGGIIGFWGITRDRTEQKNAEIALQESEARLRTIFESAAVGIAYYSIQGEFLRANKGFYDIVDYTYDELRHMQGKDLRHPDDQDAHREEIEQLLSGKLRSSRTETRLLRKDGSEVWCRISLSLAYKDRGDPIYFIAVFEDISQQKRMESQLLQAQKMEAVGTLAGGVAHDFNNLLMGIQGNVSLALVDMNASHDNYQHLKNIEHYVKAGADLTRQLLGTAKGGKYETRITDLNQVLDASSELFGRTKKEISIFRKFQQDLWSVDVDRGQIDQVLLNLYINAWQAMPEGGSLYLESKNMVLDADYVKPFGVKPGNYVRISVTDTGLGIERKHLKRIFDPFFTTKGMRRGTGLGLASAYGIVTNHGGIITVYSEKGSGASFNIYLPASEKEIIAPADQPAEIMTGHETVLFVDDEEGILEVGRLILEELGYYVISAQGGVEAVEVFRQRHDQIDLVVLDMIMPDLSGGDTYDALRRINPEIKVLLSSGYSINGQAKDILDRGCKGFIQKPFGIRAISVKLRQVLDGAT